MVAPDGQAILEGSPTGVAGVGIDGPYKLSLEIFDDPAIFIISWFGCSRLRCPLFGRFTGAGKGYEVSQAIKFRVLIPFKELFPILRLNRPEPDQLTMPDTVVVHRVRSPGAASPQNVLPVAGPQPGPHLHARGG